VNPPLPRKTLRTCTSSEMTLHTRHRRPGGPVPKMTWIISIPIFRIFHFQKFPKIEPARFDYRQTDVKANLRKVYNKEKILLLLLI
ncbi:Uncharacterized protein FWK35_00036245, partial [Aphis craccivora]